MNTMKPYKADKMCHGGIIIVTKFEGNYYVDQRFFGGDGPLRNGGLFYLSQAKTRDDAIYQARIHAKARGNAPIFVQLEDEPDSAYRFDYDRLSGTGIIVRIADNMTSSRYVGEDAERLHNASAAELAREAETQEFK